MCFILCSQGRIRTDDQLVNSELRYRCATREDSIINEKLQGNLVARNYELSINNYEEFVLAQKQNLPYGRLLIYIIN